MREIIIERRKALISDLETLDKQILTLEARLNEATELRIRMSGAVQVLDELLNPAASTLESPEATPQS